MRDILRKLLRWSTLKKAQIHYPQSKTDEF